MALSWQIQATLSIPADCTRSPNERSRHHVSLDASSTMREWEDWAPVVIKRGETQCPIYRQVQALPARYACLLHDYGYKPGLRWFPGTACARGLLEHVDQLYIRSKFLDCFDQEVAVLCPCCAESQRMILFIRHCAASIYTSSHRLRIV